MVARGENDRLMIFAPPRHTKSELSSRRFPSWYLGNNPNNQIITACYNSDLAGDFGREVRNIVDSQEYGRIFDAKLASDSKSANRWHTDSGGAYISAGVGTAVTGRGAHIALIDDPFKDRAEADSETIREKVWNWYTSTLYTRLMPGGAIVLIQTRWHEDDLAGRLLEKQKEGGDQWRVINLQAIENEGLPNEKALWPEWYDLKALKRIKSAIGQRDWTALYQQSPAPDEGTFFKREWFKRFNLGDEPKTNKYQSSDYAVTEDDGDFTEFGIIGVDSENDLWMLDWWYGQENSETWINAQLEQIRKHKVFAAFGEKGVIKRSIEPFLTKQSREKRIYTRFEWMTRTKDKPTMARAFQGMASMGKVHIPNAEWGDRLLDQLVSFPSGKNDDAVDVCALIGLAINDAHPAIITEIPDDSENLDAWGRPRRDDDESWKTA